MLIWIMIYILGAAASIGGLLPLMDTYAYVVAGICVGYIGVAAIGIWGYDSDGLRPHSAVAVAALVGGATAGLFWPASLTMGAAWLIYRYRRFKLGADDDEVMHEAAEADDEARPDPSLERRRS